MKDLIPIKKSHIRFYNDFPLYYISKNGDPLLYKKKDKTLDREMLDRNQYPRFFIKKEDEAEVVRQLQEVLNIKLAKAISSQGVEAIRAAMCDIVEEALSGPIDASLSALPETIEILLMGARKNSGLLESLATIHTVGKKLVGHCVNVLSITAQYCFFKNYPDDQVKELCLCALLHDVGLGKIDRQLFESAEKLSDKEFSEYKTHPAQGYKEVMKYPMFSKTVEKTVLEHHERLDGSGYPNKMTDICFEAQVIGLIDSYEQLKYHEKKFRKALNPFEALQIIKADVVKAKYNKKVFVDLCSCLIK
ncbi:MAG: HD domain-containing protein [Desulfobacterales bacterium]|nr:HD domain-containing protein [Desulfobacterales bacterium]